MRTLLADDHRLFRESVAILVERSCADVELAMAADFNEALGMIKRFGAFDSVFLDYDMPGMGKGEKIPMIRRLAPGSNLAIISGMSIGDGLRELISRGGISFIPKTLSGEQFVGVIKFISNGGVYLPPDMSRRVAVKPAARPGPHPDLGRLTPRERDVLDQLRLALSNKQIGRNLGIEEVTVRLHLRGVFHKLGAKNRVHAVALAYELGLPPPVTH